MTRAKTGGRQKGTPNKRTLMVKQMADDMAVDPLKILLMFANGDWEGLGYDSSIYVKENEDGSSTSLGYTIPPELRCSAAKEATQYLYAKKKEEPIEDPNEIEVNTLEEKKALLEQAKSEIALLELEIKSVENE